MGTIITYDENFAVPFSEIKLESGEHILLSLERTRLVVKALAQGARAESLLFECDDETVAVICDGLIANEGEANVPPLHLLASVVMNVPDTETLASILKAAVT
jgi:hypothetical protein